MWTDPILILHTVNHPNHVMSSVIPHHSLTILFLSFTNSTRRTRENQVSIHDRRSLMFVSLFVLDSTRSTCGNQVSRLDH